MMVWMSSSKALLRRLSKRFGFLCAESTAAGAHQQALEPTQ
jgi:hypothetical protein